MNRLQKKCLLASLSMHGLLCAIILFAPGFFTKKHEVENMPVLDVIPSKLVDAALSGGGNPNIKQPTAPIIDPNAPLPEINKTPPPPAPKEVEPVTPPKTPEVKEKPQDNVKEKEAPPEPLKKTPDTKPDISQVKINNTRPSLDPKANNAKDKTEKTSPLDRIKVNLGKKEKVVVGGSKDDGKKTSETATKSKKGVKGAEAEEGDERSKNLAKAGSQLQNSLQALRSGLSGGTSIELPGPGGEVYANWGQVVKSIYERAWLQPEELEGNSLSVEVEVTIFKDGQVSRTETRIIRRSGTGVMDKSVQRAIDSVSKVPEFPEGAKDLKRKLNIIFKLKSNRSIG